VLGGRGTRSGQRAFGFAPMMTENTGLPDEGILHLLNPIQGFSGFQKYRSGISLERS
jgi:hypothetical protein